MARTETAQIVRDNWAVQCGLDPTNIITDDATAFLSLLNKAVREAWPRAEFPYVTKTTAHVTDTFKLVDLSSNTEISEVLRAYSNHPYRSNSATRINQIPVEDDDTDGVYVPDAPASTAVAVTSLVSTGTTATLTSTTDHGLLVGESTIIAGASDSDYNGTFVVQTVTSTTVFTYTMASDAADDAPTGTITSTRATVYFTSRIRETIFTLLTQTVPFKLSSYLSTRAAGLWLKSEGQEEKGNARLAEAEDLILKEIDRVERQQGHQPPTNSNTRVLGKR